MTIRDFLGYSTEERYQKFTIYDIDAGLEIFTGTKDECIDDYLDTEVESFDLIDEFSSGITFNVCID
jgi:hypothetical protein